MNAACESLLLKEQSKVATTVTIMPCHHAQIRPSRLAPQSTYHGAHQSRGLQLSQLHMHAEHTLLQSLHY